MVRAVGAAFQARTSRWVPQQLTVSTLNADIGLKAASLIISSEDKLSALEHLSQDFPKYSAALARKVDVSQPIQNKVSEMLAMGPMPPAVYINGKAYSKAELDAFT